MDTSGVRFGTSGARGLVADMSDEVCFAYASAFLRAVSADRGRIALAMDLRPSSPRIAAACAAAIKHAGLDVDFCGAIPTPALAFHAQHGLPAIMITGSHIRSTATASSSTAPPVRSLKRMKPESVPRSWISLSAMSSSTCHRSIATLTRAMSTDTLNSSLRSVLRA